MGEVPPFFDPAGGPWRAGSALRASPARLMKGGVKTRGTFPIWVIRHLCQQFQSQGLNMKTASKAERKSILERFCVRNEMKPESVTYTVLRAEPFCLRSEMEPEKQASIYR